MVMESHGYQASAASAAQRAETIKKANNGYFSLATHYMAERKEGEGAMTQ